jgi:hypothetical protein
MDRCGRYIEKFSDYIDGGLTPAGREELARHLGECAACAREFEGFRRAHEVLCVLARPAQGRPVLAAVRARIRQEEERRKRLWWRWVPAPALAAAGLAAAFIFLRDVPRTAVDVAVQPPPAVAPAAPPALPAQPAVDRGRELAELPAKAASPVVSPALGRSSAARDVPVRVRPRPVPAARTARAPEAAQAAPASPAVAVAVETEGAPAGPKIVVVAYRPPANYCAHFTDPVSGEDIAEVSVNSTYAPDGTVRSARVVMHLPAAAKAADGNDEKSDRFIDGGDSRAWPLVLPGVI